MRLMVYERKRMILAWKQEILRKQTSGQINDSKIHFLEFLDFWILETEIIHNLPDGCLFLSYAVKLR